MPNDKDWTFNGLANNYPNASFWGRNKWYNAEDVQSWILHLKEVHERELNELREKLQKEFLESIQMVEADILTGVQPLVQNLINKYINNIKKEINDVTK